MQLHMWVTPLLVVLSAVNYVLRVCCIALLSKAGHHFFNADPCFHSSNMFVFH